MVEAFLSKPFEAAGLSKKPMTENPNIGLVQQILTTGSAKCLKLDADAAR